MSLRAAIHSCLLADARVTALIGAGAAMRHYPERAPAEVTWPYLVSNAIVDSAEQTHGQPGDTEDTLDEALRQFNCIARTVAEAEALRLAVRQALLEDVNGILAAAKIVVTSPEQRFDNDDDVEGCNAQLDLTFFHNPAT